MSNNELAPIIIKKKKVSGGDGHHGGAWKVAYADFVTAMMAFFMLMWLLNATTEKQRKGIADYFSPTIPVNRVSGGGDGAFGGDSVFTEESLAQNGSGASANHPTKSNKAKGDTGVDPGEGQGAAQSETEALSEIEALLQGKGGESMVEELDLRHVTTKLTDEGLVVEIFDLDGSPLFTPGTAEDEEVLLRLVQMMREMFDLVVNEVAINAHTQSEPVVLRTHRSWDLSAARADRVRELFEDAGLDPKRIQRITGYADRKLVTANPLAPRNNRLELILLRSDR